jgi:hypothetical protein
MNKQSPEYIRVREEIASKLFEQDGFIVEWYWKNSDKREIYLQRADSILEIKGIGILADNQDLPKYGENDNAGYTFLRGYTVGQESLIRTNFRKVDWNNGK